MLSGILYPVADFISDESIPYPGGNVKRAGSGFFGNYRKQKKSFSDGAVFFHFAGLFSCKSLDKPKKILYNTDRVQGYSSAGRVLVSKTKGRGFESFCPCQKKSHRRCLWLFLYTIHRWEAREVTDKARMVYRCAVARAIRLKKMPHELWGAESVRRTI